MSCSAHPETRKRTRNNFTLPILCAFPKPIFPLKSVLHTTAAQTAPETQTNAIEEGAASPIPSFGLKMLSTQGIESTPINRSRIHGEYPNWRATITPKTEQMSTAEQTSFIVLSRMGL